MTSLIRNTVVTISLCLQFASLWSQKMPSLPEPYATKSVANHPQVVGWIEGKTPQAPSGFKVTRFADGFKNPRWIYQAPNGDLFVSESSTQPSSANQLTLLQDTDKDGTYDARSIFLSNLNKPFGMLILNGSFYVANTDGLLQYPYKDGQKFITESPRKIVDLPEGGYNNHWTRNIVASPDGKKIYISVGSASNVGEHGMDLEDRRANILEINPDGSGERVYASGLRNPVAMQFYPGTNTLWTAVNERDELGDDLVPDYMTSVKEGGFYGWPYEYYGEHKDPRMANAKPASIGHSIVPDIDLGPHTASLGMTFYTQQSFPEKYRNGAFIGQHGSWNRSKLSGYKVVFIPMKNGKATGKPEDFLTGFIDDEKSSKVYGRPVCTMVLNDGSLLVADDASNVIWKVAVDK